MPETIPTAGPQARSPQAPPFGSSGTSQPTPNRGFEAAGLQQLGVVIQQLQDLLPKVGATSDVGQAVLKALSSLAKYVPPGSVTPAAQQQQIAQMAQKQQQNNQQLAMVNQMRQGQQAPQQQPQPQQKAA